ncbi:HD-GYP domain-containing protein [Pseudomonas aeruginosa]|uniref:HD-GYP domain-containing protein n=1 Tax=Pseudomonas aeruginosa TaxID=287 RepID=UPI00398E8E33
MPTKPVFPAPGTGTCRPIESTQSRWRLPDLSLTSFPRGSEGRSMLSLLSTWLGGTPTASRTSNHSPEALFSSLLTMAWFVEARDPYTGGHLWRVSRYARLLAEEAGLPAADVARVSLGGFLHDLGKIAIPDTILRKTSGLTDAEYEVVRTHPELGIGRAHPPGIGHADASRTPAGRFGQGRHL